MQNHPRHRPLSIVFVVIVLGGRVLGAAEAPRPNILFIFSDDLTCQAISAYGEARQLLATPHMDRIAREGMRFDRCLVTNSICGPMPSDGAHGTVLAPQRLLQQQQLPVRRHAADVSQSCCRRPATDGHHRQVAPGQRSDRLRLLAHPARARHLLQPADDRERPAGPARLVT